MKAIASGFKLSDGNLFVLGNGGQEWLWDDPRQAMGESKFGIRVGECDVSFNSVSAKGSWVQEWEEEDRGLILEQLQQRCVEGLYTVLLRLPNLSAQRSKAGPKVQFHERNRSKQPPQSKDPDSDDGSLLDPREEGTPSESISDDNLTVKPPAKRQKVLGKKETDETPVRRTVVDLQAANSGRSQSDASSEQSALPPAKQQKVSGSSDLVSIPVGRTSVDLQAAIDSLKSLACPPPSQTVDLVKQYLHSCPKNFPVRLEKPLLREFFCRSGMTLDSWTLIQQLQALARASSGLLVVLDFPEVFIRSEFD